MESKKTKSNNMKTSIKTTLNAVIALMIGAASLNAQAQTAANKRITNKYADSLRVFITAKTTADKAKLDSASADDYEGITPVVYKLIGPSTYYNEATHSILKLNADSVQSPIDTVVNAHLMELYLSNPSAVKYYSTQYNREQAISGELKQAQQELKQTLNAQLPDIDDVAKVADEAPVEIAIKRPNFWKRTGNFALQFTQNYFSENWYKGGNNNETMLATLLLQANYDDTKRVTWENKLDMRLGFVTTTSDTCHTFLTNNDKINLWSKLGIKTTKNWYYTVTAEANTQFLPGYRTNNKLKFSDFLSPLDVYISTGMDFKPKMKNGNSLSVAILPLSFKLRYIDTDNENIHNVYGMQGIYSTRDYGSRLEFNCKFTLVKNLTWRCRSYYFTSYKYAEAEMENVFSFAFSKYISSELYTLWRFDDNRGPKYYDDNLGYFQFKEYLTLGLKYDF